MILVAGAVFGLAAWSVIMVTWLSVCMIFGLAFPSDDVAIGILGLCGVAGVAGLPLWLLRSDIRSHKP